MVMIISSLISLVIYRIAEAQSVSEFPVTFNLYTRTTSNESMYTNDSVTMTTPSFNPCAETIILITGFTQPRDKPDMVASAEIIAARHYNVIMVYYNTYSYLREVSETAAKVVQFMESLEQHTGTDPQHIILIGISLGAHVAGQAGRQHKIGRIIGVDPSGPIYDLLGESDRLDSSDAQFVDVIHTSNVYGSLRKKIGHVNYVLNGGYGQPLCEPFNQYCHHVRGAYLLLASFTICNIEFQECFSYWGFKLGLCKTRPTIKFGMALDSKTAPRKGSLYYYDTPRAEFPYCGIHEQQLTELHPLYC